MPVQLDPDAAAVFKAFQQAGRPPYESISPAEARELYLKGSLVTSPEPPELASVKEIAIPGPGGAIPARLYTPKTPRLSDGMAPCLVFFHGGGWVIGNLDSHDVVCRMLAYQGELIVISVDYRLSPEAKFPAAVEDFDRRDEMDFRECDDIGSRRDAADDRRRQRRWQPLGRGLDRRARQQCDPKSQDRC